MTLSLDSVICQNGSQNSGKHIYRSIAKSITKDTDEQPEEETHRARSMGRAQSFPTLSRYASLPELPHVHKPRSSLTPYLRILMEVSSSRYDRSLTQSPFPLPFPEDEGWSGKSKLLIMACTFL